jgi:cyclase
MSARRIIPCLDIKDGKVVKGIKFQNLRDIGSPSDLAGKYEMQGADEIVLLDISATAETRNAMLGIVSDTANRISVPLTVGGGIRSKQDMADVLDAGADKVSIGSAAVADPGLIKECADEFGKRCLTVAIDSKRCGDRWEVHTHGGKRSAGIDAVEWARKMEELGAGEILLTSMDADGVKEGYDIPLTKAVADAVSIPVIASGGCGSMDHVYEVFTRTDATGALAASVFHYNECTVSRLKEYLRERGVSI